MDTCTFTYIITSGVGREGIIIDPVYTHIYQYVQLVKELGLKLVASVDTHVHADHITASGRLREQTQCESVIGDQSKAECVSLKIKENEAIDFDGLSLKALYAPCHTYDSYSFAVGDKVFTGDTMLIRGTGPDRLSKW